MEIEKGIKLVKRAWKAVALVELVVAAGALLFILSHYFSYSVFVSNLRHMALALQTLPNLSNQNRHFIHNWN
jgi:hypothetical protein